MKSVAPLGFVAIFLVSLCSCSGPSDTAQTPKVAPVDSQAIGLPKKASPAPLPQPQPDIEMPESVMARQLKDFSSEDSTYTGDSFFETQTSFEMPITEDVTVSEEVDFSGNLSSE